MSVRGNFGTDEPRPEQPFMVAPAAILDEGLSIEAKATYVTVLALIERGADVMAGVREMWRGDEYRVSMWLHELLEKDLLEMAAPPPRPSDLHERLAGPVYSDEPNDGDGWRGPWPLPDGAHRPRKGLNVVYVLHAQEDGGPLYIGSTSNALARLKQHAQDKQFAHWWCSPPFDTREDAFDAERAAIWEARPPLNRLVAMPQFDLAGDPVVTS